MPGPTPNPPPDPVIDEVREVRRRISARFDHDPRRLAEHYMKIQERYTDRLLRRPRVGGDSSESAA